MLQKMKWQNFIISYLHLQTVNPVQEPLSMAEAFHLATQGGADVLGKGDTVGNFLPGKAFDALIINGEGVTGSAGT